MSGFKAVQRSIAAHIANAWLVAGFAFLYLPILWLIVFSFNGGKLASLWGGFSMRWYAETLHDAELIDGLLCSLKIATLTAFASVVLGTLAGLVMARFKRFGTRSLFIAHINAPLVVPEVITGVSLLLFFVTCQKWLGFPSERGVFTVWVGHTSIFASYAAVVIHSRLAGMDRSVEEAAMDLGARPLSVFFLVTLPMISQALASAWLLSFTLSLDDVVTTAFLSGPGTTTLPIVIFSRMRLGLKPSVNVVATLTVVVVAVGIVLAGLWMARRQRLAAQLPAELPADLPSESIAPIPA